MKPAIKFLLILVLIGIIVLLFLAKNLEPKTSVPIGNITNLSLGKFILIEGNIISARQYNNDTFQVLTLQDATGIIKITLNANPESNLTQNLNFSKNYSVKGKVIDYNGTLEISADLVKELG